MAFITYENLQRVLTRLKNVFDTKANLIHTHTPDSVITTSLKGFISDAERVQYADKYTKTQTDTIISNVTSNYVPLTDATIVPIANKIPRANANGKIDATWLDTTSSLKLGTDYTTGVVEIKTNEDILVHAGVTSGIGSNISLYGGGVNYSDITASTTSQGSVILTGANAGTYTGGMVSISAGDGGSDVSSIGGNVLISSGIGNYTTGVVDINGIEINKAYEISSSSNPIALVENETNIKNAITVLSTGVKISSNNAVASANDYDISFNFDGTVTGTHINTGNNIVVTDSSNKISNSQLPDTNVINNIGNFSVTQTIDTAYGNVVYGKIVINTTITLVDYTEENHLRDLILMIDLEGNYSVTWPVNIVWVNGIAPKLQDDEINIIHLERLGNGYWWGYQIGSNEDEISYGTTELPDDQFNGTEYQRVLSVVDY